MSSLAIRPDGSDSRRGTRRSVRMVLTGFLPVLFLGCHLGLPSDGQAEGPDDPPIIIESPSSGGADGPDDPPNLAPVFQSSWSTATGNSREAITDGGAWPVQICDDASRARLFEVVQGSVVGWNLTPNVLQVTNQGSAICGLIGFEDKIPDVATYYLRLYINGISIRPNGLTFHSIKQAWGGGGNPVGATYWGIAQVGAGTYRPRIGGQNQGLSPFGYMGPAINQNAWYRFEYRVEFYDPANPLRMRVWPFIYDARGNLVADASGYVSDNGTLAQHYAAGGYRMAETRARGRHLFLGYEGTAGNEMVGDRWAYAGVEVRTDRFPGPIE